MKVGKIKIRVHPLLKGNRVIPPASLYKRSRVIEDAKREIEEYGKEDYDENDKD